jgi:hypothetical protein
MILRLLITTVAKNLDISERILFLFHLVGDV